MAVGKNAKKRAARLSFHADSEAQGPMHYALVAIEYRDGKRRKLTFASLTAYKNYREEFFPVTAKGRLVLVSDLESLDDSKGAAQRKRCDNKGIGLENDKRFARVKTPAPKTEEARAVSGKRFGKAGVGVTYKATDLDALASQRKEAERKAALIGLDNKAERDKQSAFTAMRRRSRASLAGL